jgi:class 3 adenylate cyclase/tetratricopeptide (TPR) repeat protein
MKCPKCQAENPTVRKFCRKCGAKLILGCPQCGFENLPDDLFCGGCGNDLSKFSEAPPLDYSVPKSYTPTFLAEKILTTRSAMEGERKLVTVLFADVANFTSLSEKLDPEEVHGIMDGCFKILMDEIHLYEGTINQFTGDGVMALFGAPVAHEDHAQRACYAALAIQKAMIGYGERLGKDHGVDFKMRIGLNSGPVIVGSIGDDLRMDYTAIGDTTNLASRMESMAKPGTVLVSKATHRLVKEYFELHSLGQLEVKGKEEPQEAFELIRAGEVATRIGASVVKGLTRFVGRTSSMAALMESWEKAQSGSGQVVGIVGEAGVGKSRLLLEFRNSLPRDQFAYLEGRCLHFGSSMAYLPFLDILRSYFEIHEEDREFLRKKKMTEMVHQLDEKLKPILSPLQDLLSLKVEDERYLKLEPKQKRERIFEGLRDLFMRLSKESLLILAVEDLHWIDKTSEEFLDYLIGWLSHEKILLILLYRPEYTHKWGNKSYFNRIGLDQLSLKSSAELVQAILEGGDVASELRDLILNRAAGNPLFMEELTHTLLENGSIQIKDHQYILAHKALELQVPDTVQGIIAARMDRLEENLKRIMQVASVIGREFAFRLLHAISGMREELKAQLLNLQGLEFIYEKSLFPELEYIFKHALTQEVAYNSLLLKRRKEIHERIGKAIEELYFERLEEFYEMLAYHYARGDVFEKASQYLKLSGKKAERRNCSWEAIHFYREAISLLDKMPEEKDKEREKLKVIHWTTFPMLHLGYPEEFLPMLQEGERLSKELDDKRSLVKIHGRMGSYYAHIGKPLTGIRYAVSAFEEAEKLQDIDLIASSAFELCAPTMSAGEFQKTVDVASGVLRLIEKTRRESDSFGQSVNVYSSLCARCGGSMAYLGRFDEAETILEKGRLNATAISDFRCLSVVELYYGHMFWAKGSWERAKEHYEICSKHSEEMKWPMVLSLARSGLGLASSFLGDHVTAGKNVEMGIKIQTDAGIEWWLPLHYVFLSTVRLNSGDLQEARRPMEKALRLSQSNNEKWSEGQSLIWSGRILGRSDPSRKDKAEEDILRGIKILEKLKSKPFSALGLLFLGECYLDSGEKEKAVVTLKKAESMFQEMGMDYWLGKAQEELKRL